jgi:hypothetical protein
MINNLPSLGINRDSKVAGEPSKQVRAENFCPARRPHQAAAWCGRRAVAAAKPGRFHALKQGFRRANLKRFPYHFIYRELPDGIRVNLVRHHRRHPDYGMERE